ncbi:MAG: ATP-dependent DNA helicase RecG [Candidatus Adiutrix sp.]|jgi:ATP-dependent DNA helicase RecG|nr:ATP-dependent DNA helicase RecG [Candidatus Adiutrix sp.]
MLFPWPRHPAFTTPVGELKGVGPKTLARLAAEGFQTTGDLLALTPRLYQDRRRISLTAELSPGQEALVEVTVTRARVGLTRGRRLLDVLAVDAAGGEMGLRWFNCPPYLPKSLPRGRRLRVFGLVRPGRRLEMIHPDLEFPPDEAESAETAGAASLVRAVYPPLGGLAAGQVKKLLDQARAGLAEAPPLLPAAWLAEHGLSDPVTELAVLHAPPVCFEGPPPRPDQTRAHSRLALFEMLFWRLLMLQARPEADSGRPRRDLPRGQAAVRDFWRRLPFAPSPEQLRVAAEITADLSARRPMSRLLQGEVGGGKTAVAAAALFFSLGRGGQAALMAPTEVLARQHFDFLRPTAENMGWETVLVTGGLPARELKAARQALASGRAHLAVGSQALLSAATAFQDLRLAVIDEQHRFGVRQRLALRRKSAQVDLLTLSATPIPRSLALTLYGDMESSRLLGLLPGRRPAETLVFTPEDRPAAYGRFLELVRAGGQGFVVTPRIDPDPIEEAGSRRPARGLEDIHRDLRRLTGGEFTFGLLHGQMEPGAGERVLAGFRRGDIRILLATTVIEVGVDVPAARTILIEGAERFGLAALHQLRGRVGRGGAEGYCLLLPQSLTEAAERRLAALTRLTDGLELAELDLEMRGPGEQLGLRQSGWPALTYARLPRDLDRLTQAHRLAADIWARRAEGPWPDLLARLAELGLGAGAGRLDLEPD